MRVVERQFSELLRRPNEVVAELVDHDVVLKRRNAPALWLTEADREADRLDALQAVVRLLRNLAVHNAAALADAVPEVFPWTEFLPPRDRSEFVDDLTRTLAASADLANFAPVVQTLTEWRATAEVHADPRLARRLRRPIAADGGHGVVPRS